MGRTGIRAVFIAAAIAVACPAPGARAFDFNGLPSNTVYGLPGDSPGDVVLSDGGAKMSVEPFVLGSSDYFYFATVEPAGGLAFDTQSLSLDNISVRFDFSDVGYNVDTVTLDVADFGGSSNFSVNDQSVFILNPVFDLPVDVAPGVTASVLNNTITLTGPIQSFLVGGQELVIDNVTAVPEPATGVLLLLGGLAVWRTRRRRRTA